MSDINHSSFKSSVSSQCCKKGLRIRLNVHSSCYFCDCWSISEQYVINISRCLNVTRKADWTFLNNLATFVGFLFSYFHRFTIGSPSTSHHFRTIYQSSSCNIYIWGPNWRRSLHSVIVGNVSVRNKTLQNIKKYQQMEGGVS